VVIFIKDLNIGLLSFKLISTFKSILRQDNKDFIKNNKSINYNNYNNKSRVNL
jgi:hypothetical protein